MICKIFFIHEGGEDVSRWIYLLQRKKYSLCSSKLLELIVHKGYFHLEYIILYTAMNQITALILGIVEGITEFLPISSTAHLLIASRLMRIVQTDFVKVFEVAIQSGAILAVFFLYVGFFLKNKETVKWIIVSFIPTALVGIALHKIIKGVFFESMVLITISLFTVGVIFLVVEYLIKKGKLPQTKSINKMTLRDALYIGFAQSLAVVPGVSRAGIVIVAMMGMKFKREEAAVYSFLLAVPTIFAATALDVYQSREILLTSTSNASYLMIGFVTSFVFAYISVRWLIGYLKNHTLVGFGIYRIVLSIFLLLFLLK